jgi:hypothetical protein
VLHPQRDTNWRTNLETSKKKKKKASQLLWNPANLAARCRSTCQSSHPPRVAVRNPQLQLQCFVLLRPKLPESSFLLWATTISPEPLLASNLHVGVTGCCLITNDRAIVRNTYYRYFIPRVVSSWRDFQANREQALWTMIHCLDTVAWLNAICGFRDGRLTAYP